MKKISRLFLFFFLLSVPAFAEPQIILESPVKVSAKSIEDKFRDELSLVSRKSLQLGNGMISRIKKLNDSYRLTAQAVRLLADRGDIRGAVPLLQNAVKNYDGNRLAYLLLGYAQEKIGNTQEAAKSYRQFYKNSLSTVPIERQLIGPSSLTVFRAYVETRFKTWDMTLPPPVISIDLNKMRSVQMLDGSPTGQRINLFLPFILISGLIFWILSRLLQIDFPPGPSFFFTHFYGLAVLGYGLWAAHFFFGLPFLISLEMEFKLFCAGGISGIFLLYAASRFLEDRQELKLVGAVRCSHCRKVISRIEAQCPHCGRPQT